MLLLDVNVLIHAHRRDSQLHGQVRPWLDALVNGSQQFAVPGLVLSAVVRVVTRPPFSPPSTIDEALDFCAAVMASPVCQVVQPGPGHWAIFDELCRRVGATGKLVPDAYLAAMALERGFEWVTFDRDFGRFPGLVGRDPFAAQATTNPR